MSQNVEINYLKDDGSYEVLYPEGRLFFEEISYTGTGDTNGYLGFSISRNVMPVWIGIVNIGSGTNYIGEGFFIPADQNDFSDIYITEQRLVYLNSQYNYVIKQSSGYYNGQGTLNIDKYSIRTQITLTSSGVTATNKITYDFNMLGVTYKIKILYYRI